MSWLDELKEGDKVHISGNLALVVRLTEKQIIVRYTTSKREQRFWKKDGREVGKALGYATYLAAYDDVHEKAKERRAFYLYLESVFIDSPRMQRVPLSALQQIEAILVEHGVIKEEQP